MYAHTQTFLPKNHGRSIVQVGYTFLPRLRDFTFISRLGLYSRTLAHMLDSLVRVSRRVDEMHFVSVLPKHGRPKSFPTFRKERNRQ